MPMSRGIEIRFGPMTRSRDLILQELARESAGLTGLERSRDEARARIEFLRSELANTSFATPIALSLPPAVDVNTPRTSAEKAKLFRSLFRGREDIFPTHLLWICAKAQHTRRL